MYLIAFFCAREYKNQSLANETKRKFEKKKTHNNNNNKNNSIFKITITIYDNNIND